MSGEGEKDCGRCGQPKPLSEFEDRAGGLLGQHNRCRECVALYGRGEVKGSVTAELIKRGLFEEVVLRQAVTRKRHTDWVKRKRAAGLCGSCGRNRTVGGYFRCEDCRRKRSGRHNFQAAERKRARAGTVYCKKCGRLKENPDRVYCATCYSRRALKRVRQRPFRLVRDQRRRQSVKARVFEMYGDACACCGLADARFLTIDHVNNDGKQDRAGGWTKLRELLKTKRDDLQLLCWNCNMGKEANGGTCPHKILIRGRGWNVVQAA